MKPSLGREQRLVRGYTVLAESEDGNSLWVFDAVELKRHGGLVWNGSTGEAWDNVFRPRLVRRDAVER